MQMGPSHINDELGWVFWESPTSLQSIQSLQLLLKHTLLDPILEASVSSFVGWALTPSKHRLGVGGLVALRRSAGSHHPQWQLLLVSMAFAMPKAACLPEHRLHGLGCGWL